MTHRSTLKQYQSGKKLQTHIINGINKLADNVASTLGPRGRNVILMQGDSNPIITKDGVTVANFVDFENPFENAAAQIVKQAASQTNSMAGDGTTTSIVLARSILNNSQKYLAAGASPVDLKRGMDKAVMGIIGNLKEMSHPISSSEDIEHIATISANGDESIGRMIAMAVDQAGKDGAITIEEGRAMQTTLDVVEGFRFDAGYFAAAFATNEKKGTVEYDNALILVTDYKINSVQEILPVLEIVSREGRPFVIVAEEVEGQALAAIIMNSVRGTMRVAAAKAPRYGQERRNILKDLCISVGATFVSRESGIKLSNVELQHLGDCKKIEITKNFTTIVDGTGNFEEIEKRIEALKLEIKQTSDLHECERIQERITRLASGVAIISVGAPTEIEMIEKKHRIEDALEAVKSAQEEGIIPGGGVALLKASKGLNIKTDNEDQKLGVEIIIQAVRAPIRQMAKNAGRSPDIILQATAKTRGNRGYDFTKDKIVDMIENGIIDPVKVTRVALQNSTSVASTIITTNFAIVEG